MTKQEVFDQLIKGNGLLRGTTRPTAEIQLDKWEIEGIVIMVTTTEQWPNRFSTPQYLPRTYNPTKVIRVEQLIELL